MGEWKPGNRGGESETAIRKLAEPKRQMGNAIIATKIGMELAPDKKGLSKQYICERAKDSLKRLRTDCIDLYQSHKDDPEAPLEETLEAYSELVKQGKVRAMGASNYSGPAFVSFGDRRESLQPQYNSYERSDHEENL